MRAGLILALILAILAVVFALQNPGTMDVSLGPFEFHGPTALILMVTLCVGVLAGILATLPKMLRQQKDVRRAEKRALSASEPTTYPPSAAPDYSEAPAYPPDKDLSS